MKLFKITHPVFTSNSYVIFNEESNYVTLIDIGYYDGIKQYLTNKSDISEVFITHPHYDHIFDINRLMNDFPNCTIYLSEYTSFAIKNSKENLSYYRELPVEYLGNKLHVIKDENIITLKNNLNVKPISTPGHNIGSLCFQINNYLFTGDSYIPDFPIVTKLKGGNKAENKKSLLKLRSLITLETIICPGHGNLQNYTEIDFNYFNIN